MEKGQMSSSGGAVFLDGSSSGAAAQNPLPSAPPSYEEAVGLAAPSPVPVMPMGPAPGQGAPPYPMAGPQMPMPSPYAGSATPMMPLPVQHAAPVQPQAPEIRVTHQHVSVSLGPHAIKMNCPSCHADIKTTTMSDHQPSAHVCCIILCLLGCCLCSCLPYCLSAFLSVHHFCPNCKAYIGTWKG